VRAAAEHYDGRDGLLGRCRITQSWRLALDRFPAEIVLPLSPSQSIDEITYVDEIGTPQTFTAFRTMGLGTVEGARLSPVSQWPPVGEWANPTERRPLWKAGFDLFNSRHSGKGAKLF
jgi:hypothetical protein